MYLPLAEGISKARMCASATSFTWIFRTKAPFWIGFRPWKKTPKTKAIRSINVWYFIKSVNYYNQIRSAYRKLWNQENNHTINQVKNQENVGVVESCCLSTHHHQCLLPCHFADLSDLATVLQFDQVAVEWKNTPESFLWTNLAILG